MLSTTIKTPVSRQRLIRSSFLMAAVQTIRRGSTPAPSVCSTSGPLAVSMPAPASTAASIIDRHLFAFRAKKMSRFRPSSDACRRSRTTFSLN